MSSINVQSLVNLFQHVSAADLDKSLSLDLETGAYRVDRGTVAGSKRLDERMFVTADHSLTELGERNMLVRMKVANALKSLAAGVGAAPEMKKFFDAAVDKLLGNVPGGDVATLGKPLEMRVVKQMLATAGALRALANQRGEVSDALADAMKQMDVLEETAALNGKQKTATKLMDRLDRELLGLSAELQKATTDEDKQGIMSRIGRALQTFKNESTRAVSKMTTVNDVARKVLGEYARKGGKPLGDLAQKRFMLHFSRECLEPGMNVKQLRAKLKTELPGFVEGLDSKPLDISGKSIPHVRIESLIAARTAKTKAEQLVTDQKNLTAKWSVSLGEDDFRANDIFLRAQPAAKDSFSDVRDDFVAAYRSNPPRTDIKSISIDGIGDLFDSEQSGALRVAAMRMAKAEILAAQTQDTVRNVETLCGGNELQMAGVLSAFKQRVDVVAKSVADELKYPGLVDGNRYELSRAEDGSVLMKISTVPESSLQSSVTLRIAPDGTRTVEKFSGVKTNEKYIESVELKARREKLEAELPGLRMERDAAVAKLEKSLAEYSHAIDLQDQQTLKESLDSVKTFLDGKLSDLEALSKGKPDGEDFSRYLSDYRKLAGEAVERCGMRLKSGFRLATSLDGKVDGLVEKLNAKAKEYRQSHAEDAKKIGVFSGQDVRKASYMSSGNDGVAAQLEAFAAEIKDCAKRLKSDFFLSGEASEESFVELAEAFSNFSGRIDEMVEKLPGAFNSSDDFKKLHELLGTPLPCPTFTTFSEEAVGTILQQRGLLSVGDISRLALGDPRLKPLAESVNTFATSVNGLLDDVRQWAGSGVFEEISEFARARMDEIGGAVKQAIAAGVDFGANGIGGILRDAYGAILDKVIDARRGAVDGEIKTAVGNLRARFERILGQPNLREGQRTAVANAKKALEALDGLEAIERQSPSVDGSPAKTVPTMAWLKAFVLHLNVAGERFLAEVFDPRNSSFLLSKFNSIAPFAPPSPQIEEELTIRNNPFADSGFKSASDVLRMARATAAYDKALKANPGLLEQAIIEFETLDGAERYFVIDEDGNSHGFKEVDGRSEGRELVEATFKNVIGKRIAELAESIQDPGSVVDVAQELTTELKGEILSEVKGVLGKILKDANVDVESLEEKRLASEQRQNEVLKRGANVFGLDVDSLGPEQMSNLKRFTLLTLLDSQREKYEKLKAQADNMPETTPEEIEAKKARQQFVENILDRWVHEGLPLQIDDDGNPMAEKTPAIYLSNACRIAFGEALVRGQIPLDGTISEDTLGLIVQLSRYPSNATVTGMAQLYKTGLGTEDPALILNVLRKNGFSDEVVARLRSADVGFTGRRLSDMISALYLVNGKNPGGIDSLCLRLFGVDFADLTYNTYRVFENQEIIPITGAELEREDGVAVDYAAVDILRDISGNERLAADFVMRNGIPTTEFAKDTVAAYRALGEVEGDAGKTATFTYAGCNVELGVNARGRLVFTLKDVDVDGETKDVQLLCPLDAKSFHRQLGDEMSANVKAYGAATLLGIMPNQDDTSATARQMALNVIKGATGVLGTELCNLPTGEVLSLAYEVLNGMNGNKSFNAKALVESRISTFKGDGVVCFNGEATLECYRRMEDGAKGEDQLKVTLPPKQLRSEGESREQARIRQVHEFVSELVMPNDTTKYDLLRRAGKSESDILRDTLRTHRYELGVVLNTLGTSGDVLNTFSLAAGEGKDGGAVMRMNEMESLLKANMGRLKFIIAGAGGMDAFFAALDENREVPGLDEFLAGFASELEKASDSMLGKMQEMLTDKLTAAFRKSMEAKNKPIWQQTLDEIAGSGTLDVDSGYGKFLMDSLATYFLKMEPIDRHRMASSIFRFANSSSSTGELLGALIKGAGPVLQKLMQGLPQTALPPDLRKAVADLKSRLPPIAPEMVRATLLDLVNQSNGRITKIDLIKSYGAATVGQTFLCRIYTTDNPYGEECVVKLLRPDVQNRARRERELFLELAEKNPTMKKALRSRIDSIFEELDFTIEANNVKQGVVYNSGKETDGVPGVRSMELYPYITASANVMVLRKAPGTTYDRYVSETSKRVDKILGGLKSTVREDGTVSYTTGDMVKYAESRRDLMLAYTSTLKRQQRLSTFIQRFTYEAFFGTGFVHGDLHDGNFIGDEDFFTVLDFGNARKLSKDEMTSLKWALAWIPARNVGNFLDYYRELLTSEGKTQFDKKRALIASDLRNVFERGDVSDAGRAMSAAMQVIQRNGVELPGSLFCILQSMQRLDEAMRLMNEQLARIEESFRNIEFAPATGVAAEQAVGGEVVIVGKDEAGGSDKAVPSFLKRANDAMNEEVIVVPPKYLKYFNGKEKVNFTEYLSYMRQMPEEGRREYFTATTDTELPAILRHALGVGEQPGGDKLRLFESLDAVYGVDGYDAEKAGDAMADIRKQVSEYAAYVKSRIESGDVVLSGLAEEAALSMDEVAETLDAIEAARTGAEGAAMPDLKDVKGKLGAAIGKLFYVCNQEYTVPIYRAIRNELSPIESEFKPYDDPSRPFGLALGRGAKSFLDEIMPRDKGTMKMVLGGVSLLFHGGVTLRNSLLASTKDEYRRAHRVTHFESTQPWSTFAADNRIYQREVAAIEGEIANFRFQLEVRDDLGSSAWLGNAGKRDRIVQTLKFNVDNILAGIRKKGFAADVDDPNKRAALIRFAMTKVAISHPEWYRSLKGVNERTLSGAIGGDADVATAFKCLHELANANPPINDALTEEDEAEIKDTFN